jgi:hypothetical protein
MIEEECDKAADLHSSQMRLKIMKMAALVK